MVAIVLAVFASLAPFFGSYGFSLLLSVFALLTISWLFQAEFFHVLRVGQGWQRLIVPVGAFLLIVLAMIVTTWTVGRTESVNDQPAMTLDEVTEEINAAATGEERPIDAKTDPRPTRVVASREVPQGSAAQSDDLSKPTSTPTPSRSNYSALMEETRKKVNAMNAGQDEYWACSRARTRASSSLFSLTFQAAQHQNAYYYGRNSKLMVTNLETWLDSVRGVFAEHAEILPSVDIVELARPEGRANNFLGIDNAGDNAWAEMQAKVDVLKALQTQMDDKSACEQIRNTALAQCIKLGQCTAEEEKEASTSQKPAEIEAKVTSLRES